MPDDSLGESTSNFYDSSSQILNFTPLDKVVELFSDKDALYERMLTDKDELYKMMLDEKTKAATILEKVLDRYFKANKE